MQAWQQILLGLIGGISWTLVGYKIGSGKVAGRLMPIIRELETELWAAQNPEIKEAQKFRIRTAEADSSRHTRVRKARLRAFRSITPEPRKPQLPR